MSPPPASSGETSPDSSRCGSDPGDVLIRSTRVLLSDRRHGPGPGPGPGSVQITVHRLRDRPVQPPGQQQRAAGQPQPGLSSSRCPGSTGDLISGGAVRDRQGADIQTLQKPGCGSGPGPISRTRPRSRSGPGSTKENRKPPAAESPDRKFAAGTESNRQPGHDLLTSRFAAGGRGVVLAALKQRSHSAPHRREVKVQLLDPQHLHTSSQDTPGLRTSSQDALGVTGVQVEAGFSSGCSGDAATAAAAAVAIKAHSDMEARVSHLAEGVQKLLQADREGGVHGRSLSQQMLHHLETLHSHQLQLQSQLLESALRIVTSHTPVTPMTPDPAVTSHLPAAGQQPCLQVTHLDAAENVLSNQQRSSSATRAATVEMDPVTMATPRWPEQTRADLFHQGAASISTATQPASGSHLQPSANHSEAVGRRVNEMLREMGRLKSEMKMLLTQPEDSLKTTRPGPDHPPSQQHLSQPNHFQSLLSSSQPTEPQQNQIHQTQQSVLVQRRPPVPSMLEEAGRVLRQVQRQKKVLEENLEALVRAQTGEVLHCQLEALAANRDWTQEVRIKKTVDAWISTLTKDIQDEMSSEDAVCHPPADVAVTSQKAVGSSAHTDRGRPLGALRGTGSRTVAGRGSRRQTAEHRAGAEPDRPTGRQSGSEQVEVGGDSYLTHLYGRAPYEGLRRTLKKSPYLRFSSPASPLSRKPRPRLVESVRGVKVKSCKTQTCLAPSLSPSPGRPQHHHTISSSHVISGDPPDLTVTPADSYPVPMAIPLGRPRMDSSSRCLAEHRQEATSPPTAPPTSSVVAVDDRVSELQTQEAEQLDAGEAPHLSPVGIMERKTEEVEDEELFPGTDFLSVADAVQQEERSVGEEVLELDGGPSPPPVLYQGPVFPPQAPSALAAQDQASVPDSDLQRDALENRLVEWVEQQLMSRMITEMYRPPPSDPAQNNFTDQSEPEEQSLASDSAEAAGLQLFVDANMSIDSALIRQLVNEVLTEQVALMLGHRDMLETGPGPSLEPPKPGPGADQEEKLVPLLPTPEPTPPPSPPRKESPPLSTPPPSEPTSLLNEESPRPITAAEHVATPTSSPEPAHSTGSPPGVHQAPPPLTWEDAELPLDEERLEEQLETHPQPLVMSVAEEEPPVSSPFPPPPSTPAAPSPSPPRPPSPDPRPASSSSSSSSSTESSSSSETAETDAALRHISEGELLISVNQLAAMTEEEAVCSFSSSLQEMDFDPPSEGQVRGHDLLLTLLTKMEQGVTHTHRGERPQPEGSWGRDQEDEASVGEVRDNWTTNPSSYRKSTAARQGQTSSPGQISECADVSDLSFEATNQGAAAVRELVVEPMGTLTSDLHTDLSLSPPPHLESTHTADQGVPVLDKQTAEQQQGGSWRMKVRLPSITVEEEEESLSAADTDSSTNDVF